MDDIARLDLRRWKLKGLAIATLKPECGGARIRLDGLTYGGFRKEDSPHNAEDFMKALLSLYRGEIVDYEEIPDAGGRLPGRRTRNVPYERIPSTGKGRQ